MRIGKTRQTGYNSYNENKCCHRRCCEIGLHLKNLKSKGSKTREIHRNIRSFTIRHYPYIRVIMKPIEFFLAAVVFTISAPFIDLAAQTNTDNYEKIRRAEWEKVEIADGFAHLYYQFPDLFNSTQSVTVFLIDLNGKIRADIDFPSKGFLKTSESGKETGAIAAINGSFFNTKSGGSTVFFKKDGRIIDTGRRELKRYRENAGFLISKKGRISIIGRPNGGWQAIKQPTVLTSGPLLIENGRVVDQVAEPFNTSRHPRTAIGLTDDNHLVAVVVDGRNKNAQGVSISELSMIMKALGCKEAMNLDGGGSSTAWIKDKGVVNFPSDNKLFDHEGERPVVTVIDFFDQS